jgi:ABC-2 type transport system ATP-binding protein
MKRRLTLAMGLVNSPRLLFLDEPTSGLDVQSNLIIREVISDLILDEVTVFLTIHNIEEANVMCDRVAIINKGSIIAIDSPEYLKKTFKGTQSIEVSFDRNPADRLDELGRFSMINEIQKAGDKFKLYTEDPAEVIDAIVAYAHTHNLKIISITLLAQA